MNKILYAVIVLLTISLIIMTYLYFNMREIATRNLNAYVDVATILTNNADEGSSEVIIVKDNE